MAGIFSQIAEIYGYLTGEQRVAADMLQRNPAEAAQMADLAAFADFCGVEESQALRFIQSLGYLDFAQFSADLRESLEAGDLPQVQMQQMNPVFENAARNLDRTVKMLYPAEVERALELMEGATRLYLLGMRSSFALAYYLYTRLSRIRPEVRLIHTTGLEYPEELAGIGRGDVMVVFLFPQYSHIAANLILLARSRGAKVILIADENHSALEGYGDVLLPCFVRGTGEKISLAAPLVLAEHLAEALIGRNPVQSAAWEQEAEQLLLQSYELGK